MADLRHSRTLSLRRRDAIAAGLWIALAGCNLSASVGTKASTNPPTDSGAAAPAPQVTPTIDSARMFAALEYLSSDELRGRFTFSDDLGTAADFLAKQYTAAGISPVGSSYRAPFEAAHGTIIGDELTVWLEQDGNSQQMPRKELVTLASGNGKAVYEPLVVIKDLSSARASDVRSRIVVAPAPPVDQRDKALREIVAHEPAGVLLVGERPPPDGKRSVEALSDLPFPVAWIERSKAGTWLGIDVSKPRKPSKSLKMSMAARPVPKMESTFNVLATMKGTEHPEQIVMLGAHYDHIGTVDNGVMCRRQGDDEICNGADDNGSGTAMVLEVARAFVDAGYQPKRTLVFAHFAGEELGLYGSKALANDPPDAAPFAGGTVVAMVNLDMVGRYGDKGLAIGATGSSDQWLPLLQEVEPPELEIVYERAVNGRSDHANYYRKKVPVLFFFTGIHDDYHQAGDHFDKINKDAMVSIGQMVADITRTLADGAPIEFAEPRTDNEGVVSRMPGSDESTVERHTRERPANQ